MPKIRERRNEMPLPLADPKIAYGYFINFFNENCLFSKFVNIYQIPVCLIISGR